MSRHAAQRNAAPQTAAVPLDLPVVGQSAAFFDVYDIRADCAHPQLKASLPVNTIGHEGEWSQDGMTYYATAIGPGATCWACSR